MSKPKPRPCSNCGLPHQRKGQRYCAKCHRDYQRRRRHILSAEQKAFASFLRRYGLAVSA